MPANSCSLQGQVDGRLIRGGTSRGFFVREENLPNLKEDLLDELVLELFGSPDPIQVDGIGGSHSHTSKLMIVGSSERDSIDIEYRFGQVAVEKPVVDWSGNCGNLTSAVGMFAIKERLVECSSNSAEITLYNTNTDTVVRQTVPLCSGAPTPYGEYEIDGVSGSGARVDSTFVDPAGGVFGALSPTDELVETVTVDNNEYEVSVVDISNPCVFIRARDLDLAGTELPATLAKRTNLLETLELIRGKICEQIGLVDNYSNAEIESPTVPFIALVSEPQSYTCSDGKSVGAEEIDITSRIITTQSPHHAYAMTGAMCLAAASQIRGTIPNEFTKSNLERVNIGHPKGIISVGVSTGDSEVSAVTVSRTVREIMRGTVLYRRTGNLEDIE